MQAIVAATSTNAELFRMEDRIGTVEEGKDADLILVDGNPADDLGVLVAGGEHPVRREGWCRHEGCSRVALGQPGVGQVLPHLVLAQQADVHRCKLAVAVDEEAVG